MDIFRGTVLTVCAAGMISSLMQSAAVGSSGKKMMKLLVNTIVILSIIHPFVENDLSEDISELTSLEEDSFYLSLESDFSKYYITNAEISVKYELEAQLKEKEIKYASLDISCEMDEYHVITVSNIEIKTNDRASADKAVNLINALLPETDVTVYTEDINEQDEAQG